MSRMMLILHLSGILRCPIKCTTHQCKSVSSHYPLLIPEYLTSDRTYPIRRRVPEKQATGYMQCGSKSKRTTLIRRAHITWVIISTAMSVTHDVLVERLNNGLTTVLTSPLYFKHFRTTLIRRWLWSNRSQ